MNSSKPIKINDKFKSLFEEKTRYYIITGERGTSKSFTVNTFLTLKLLQAHQTILFTRFTLTSAKDSIIPEFKEKIDLLNLSGKFDITNYDIINHRNESSIMFRGIKTSQGDQTAKLKSLTNVNIWVLDEAEELTDEKTFDKINLSIRSKRAKNIIILILNPAPKTHWIYKRFFLNIVPDDFNGTKGNVTYINLELDDNIDNLDVDLVNELLWLKENDPIEYNLRVQKAWLDNDDSIVFNYSKLKWFDEIDLNQAEIVSYCDVADQGTDFLCFIVAAIIGENVFIIDVIYTQLGSEVTEGLIIDMFDRYQISRCIFESNNQGLMFTKLIKKSLPLEKQKSIFAMSNSTNKHTRIITQRRNILDCHFKRTNEKMYTQFLTHLTSYTFDAKFEPDDAPDAMSGLVKDIYQIVFPRLKQPIHT